MRGAIELTFVASTAHGCGALRNLAQLAIHRRRKRQSTDAARNASAADPRAAEVVWKYYADTARREILLA